MRKASRSVLGNAIIVGAMTFISRLGGLVREILMAHFFGTALLKSAFDVAFKIPNLFRRLFGEGALSTAFIPIFTEVHEKQGPDAANNYAARCAGLLIAILTLAVGIGILLTYPIATCLDEGSKWATILPLLRIMLPYALLICVAALVMGILNALHSFTISALTPAFLNLVWILALVVVCPLFTKPGDQETRIRIVAWSIVVAGAVQVLVQLPALRSHGVPIRIAFDRRISPEIKRTVALMIPMVISGGITQINVILDGIIALYASTQGPAALQYAERLVYLPLGLIGNAYGTVLLPVLSSFAAKKDYGSMEETINRSLRNITLITIPAAVGLVALAFPIISFIYQTGHFDSESVRFTAYALIGYGPGLLFFALYKAIVPPFYALQDAKTPMRVGLYYVGLNFVLNITFVCILPHDWKHVGIALATVICSLLNCATLLSILRRRLPGTSPKVILRPILQAFVPAVLMAFASYEAESFLCAFLKPHMHAKLALAGSMGVSIALAIVLYFGTLRLFHPTALRELVSDFRNRKTRRTT